MNFSPNSLPKSDNETQQTSNPFKPSISSKSPKNKNLGPLFSSFSNSFSSNSISQSSEQNKNISFDSLNGIISLFPPSQSNFSIHSKPPIIFQPSSPSIIHFSNFGSFGIIKCENVTSYFLGQVACSQITFPEQLEQDTNLKIKVLYRGEKLFSNSLSIKTNKEIFKLSETFYFNEIDQNTLRLFIVELNDNFFYDNKYTEIIQSKSCDKAIYYFIILICLLIFGVLVYYLISNCFKMKRNGVNSILIIIISCVVVGMLILLIVMNFIFGKIRELPFRFIEAVMSYRIANAERIEKFIEKSNDKFFANKKVKIWCPVSLDYVLFNFDMEQDVQIQSHTLEEGRKKEKQNKGKFDIDKIEKLLE